MKSNHVKTWQQLADALGFSVVWLRQLRADSDAPKTKDVSEWKRYLANRAPAQGQKDSQGESMAALKLQLMVERTKKEAALAGLRQIELRREEQNLVPESFAVDRMRKTLVPLRKLLDSLPRACASQCNPQQPMVAEIALREALDERVFSEMVRIIDRFEAEDVERKNS